ncbi:recombinase family protein [Bradyrhizobium japonicum]|uniref:recombinase family protein n=2 Tax=Bradyrhizobium japonicum TaxID=375 RepID=UPI0028149763|nr:recombinase family protein [Bradyrhizobium japonicum]
MSVRSRCKMKKPHVRQMETATVNGLEQEVGLRACGYFRASTSRQTEAELTIPSQIRAVDAFCDRKGWELVARFVEQGATATDDNRPEFQKMIERACDDDHPYDVIVVYAFSRFFRDGFTMEMYIRKLAKAGVRLVSITQELGDDPAQVMMRQIIGLFDEYQSRENGKHVRKAMVENARQGFYNGSPIPLGYKTVEIDKRGARIKKKLAIDAVEAETVKLIFRLYREGDGTSGPLGVKNLTTWLNERGYRTRRGARFGVATVHGILTNTVYIGEWVFNKRDSRTQQPKPVNEHVTVEVPGIIPRTEFEAVSATLKTRDPRVTAPRVVTGPILLTGIATCAGCNGAMTLRTGTSSTGKVHKYYTCSTCARQGKTGCKGRSVQMAKLDAIVVENLAERLFQPERLKLILGKLAERRSEQAAEVDQRVANLRSELTAAEDKLKRLYAMVENGLTELDDILKDRVAALKTDRDRAKEALDRIKLRPKPHDFDDEAIERFGRLMRENIASGPIAFRKAYIKSVVDRVEVDDHAIRIVGDKATLEQVIAGDQNANPNVRSFVRKWRTRHDSNV